MSGKNSHRDWVKRAVHDVGFERIEAFFNGHAYTPHRHDTYAIGHTLSGVQSFHYRRGMRHSLPGGTLVLHPDELHDGEAGTKEGFHYRMIYIEPALIQQILGGKPLPFIADGISQDPRLHAAAAPLLNNMDQSFDPLEREDALYDLAQALNAVGGRGPKRRPLDYRAAETAREFIHEHCTQEITLDDLSRVSGRDRWSLSRDFRALFGTSPYRYVTLRRLDLCRRFILTGEALVDAAIASGFADQSHMTRHFVNAYGVSPARWLRVLNHAR